MAPQSIYIPTRLIQQISVTWVVVLVGLSIILFEVFPEKSVWSIPLRQADEHMIAVSGPGGFYLLMTQNKKKLTTEQQRFWKRILIIDDDADTTVTFKTGIEDSNNDARKRIEVRTANNPAVALSQFKPDFYDLLLVDINQALIEARVPFPSELHAADGPVKLRPVSAGFPPHGHTTHSPVAASTGPGPSTPEPPTKGEAARMVAILAILPVQLRGIRINPGHIIY